MNEGIRLFIDLIQISERLDEKIFSSGTSTLDTNETLPLKMECAETLAKIDYVTTSGDFSEVEKKVISNLIMKTRMKYRIQSGIYTVAECKIAERNKND